MVVDLLKVREEQVKVSLKKFSPDTDIIAEVNFILDVSGSMSDLFYDDTMQETVERIFPIARVMAYNNQLGMGVFNHHYFKLNDITMENYKGYVTKFIVDRSYVGGGTAYGPFIKVAKCKDYPVFNIVITDGDNSDKRLCEELLRKTSSDKVFWQFVGIGGAYFSFLKSIDTMGGRINDNVGFFEINDLNKLSDEDLYNKLLSEFPKFLECFSGHCFKRISSNVKKKWYEIWK